MVIKLDQLEKRYREDKQALFPLQLTLDKGIYGLLGPNGAGKSTLMNILAMIEKPTRGKVMVDGHEVSQIEKNYKSKLGYLPQTFGLIPVLTGREFLMYIAALKGISSKDATRKVQELLNLLNLASVGDYQIHTYSGGMKQRVGIGQALLNEPAFLLLDEPTVGLDPDERVFFKRLIMKQAEHSTVLLSTHIVSDVEALATHIIVMKQGRVLVVGEVEQLKQSINGLVWKVPIKESHTPLNNPHIYGSSLQTKEGLVSRVLSYSSPAPQSIPLEPTLEDVYLYFIHQEKLKGVSEDEHNEPNEQSGWAGKTR
jgi:ABC-2 type transport system ATP-binding protein